MAGLALQGLLSGAIDYAGCFPPASLPLHLAVENYLRYRSGDYGWILGRLVLKAEDIAKLSQVFRGDIAAVGADDPRASSVELRGVAQYGKPTYCEVPIANLQRVRDAGSFAKLRTGGLTAELVPDVAEVTTFIAASADLKLPFKSTAGLHHALRGIRQLTYEQDSPTAWLHGFINVLFAACSRWNDPDAPVSEILNETKSTAFRFDDQAGSWGDRRLSIEQIRRARQEFVHSFGSCSFEEPVEELRMLGWL